MIWSHWNIHAIWDYSGWIWAVILHLLSVHPLCNMRRWNLFPHLLSLGWPCDFWVWEWEWQCAISRTRLTRTFTLVLVEPYGPLREQACWWGEACGLLLSITLADSKPTPRGVRLPWTSSSLPKISTMWWLIAADTGISPSKTRERAAVVNLAQIADPPWPALNKCGYL